MKIKTILAVALATASCSSLAIGVAFTATTGNPAAFILGTAAFIGLAITAAQLDPTI